MMLNLNNKSMYLLACSFGPDSMALFDMLYRSGVRFEVAHVNYHLRKEADFESASLTQYCAERGIAIHVYNSYEQINTNIEAKCRIIRYQFFKKLCKNGKYDSVLVAHNIDDHLETYLLQKQRNNIPSYYGLKEENVLLGVKIIRPLLNFSKNQLLKYCTDNNVPFSIDSSNLEDKFLRNQIRHKLIEKMDYQQKNKLLEEVNNANKYRQQFLDGVRDVNFNDFDKVSSFSNTEFAVYLFSKICELLPITSLSMGKVLEVKKLYKSDKANAFVSLGDGLYFVKEYDSFSIRKDEPCEYSYVINEPCIFDCPYFFLDFTKDSSNRNVFLQDYPLTVRTVNPCDKYLIKDYQVQVRRLFIDWKMPVYLRKKWPIITNKNQKIIYIPRYRKNFQITGDCNFFVKE